MVAAVGHDEARAWGRRWAAVDVVLVDAADERRAGDQFPGVAVVRAVRAATPENGPLVMVVTGHYLHDGLRHRMAEAGADFFFLRAELWSPAALLDVVLHPERHRRGVPPVVDPGAAQVLGLGPGADLEGLVGWIDGQDGLGDEIDPGAGRGRRVDPRSRRWLRVRRGAADAGRIRPVNLTTGGPPRDSDVPSVRQLGRLWAWAARVGRPDHPDDPDRPDRP